MNTTKIKRRYRNEGLQSKDSFWMVRKSIAKTLGLGIEGAAYLAELIEYNNYLLGRGLIKPNDFFYYRQQCPRDENGKKDYSQKSIESETGITKNGQDKYISLLKEYGFLEVIKRGMPNRMLYKINFSKIDKFERELEEGIYKEILDDYYDKNTDNDYI